MPRKKNQPVAEFAQAQAAEAHASTGGIPEHMPEVPEAAAETPTEQPTPYFHARERNPELAPARLDDTSFDVAKFDDAKSDKSRLASIADDRRNGIRIEHETSRQPGQVSPRIFIRFADDKRPGVDEKKMLTAERFAYDVQEKAWAAPKSATSTLLAKRCVNEITKLRDPDGLQLYI